MALTDYGTFDALGLAQLVAQRDVKPSELLEEAIARTEAMNPKLNAIVYKDYDNARNAAKAELPKGVFAGVPFLLKDIMALTTTMPTRQGSAFIPPIPWFHDSVVDDEIQTGRPDPVRQNQRAGIRPCRDDGIQTLWRRAQSLESGTFHRRLVRRFGGGGCGRHLADGARQ